MFYDFIITGQTGFVPIHFKFFNQPIPDKSQDDFLLLSFETYIIIFRTNKIKDSS